MATRRRLSVCQTCRKNEGKLLIFLDLYKTTGQEFERMLRQQLPSALSDLHFVHYRVENMSQDVKKVFEAVAAELGLKMAS